MHVVAYLLGTNRRRVANVAPHSLDGVTLAGGEIQPIKIISYVSRKIAVVVDANAQLATKNIIHCIAKLFATMQLLPDSLGDLDTRRPFVGHIDS